MRLRALQVWIFNIDTIVDRGRGRREASLGSTKDAGEDYSSVLNSTLIRRALTPNNNQWDSQYAPSDLTAP